MSWITVMGFVAGTCTTAAFLPQVAKMFLTKKTQDISLFMYIILATGVLLWTIYGFINEDIPLLLANGITLVFVCSILVLKLRHG
ncbi:MAG: hypothetical protein CMH81_05735 [Nitrospiraceae bacterium]|nr:hypothetical protein [Nitrospiraceae bacterium]|tara:strand:+ start:3584 stop:3838 length:255 start_codon:yes stop_codon:yes gene_type:complete